jgi:hypothetical protein
MMAPFVKFDFYGILPPGNLNLSTINNLMKLGGSLGNVRQKSK